MPHKEEDRSDQGLQLKYKEVKLVQLGGGKKTLPVKGFSTQSVKQGNKDGLQKYSNAILRLFLSNKIVVSQYKSVIKLTEYNVYIQHTTVTMKTDSAQVNQCP